MEIAPKLRVPPALAARQQNYDRYLPPTRAPLFGHTKLLWESVKARGRLTKYATSSLLDTTRDSLLRPEA